MIFIKLLNWFDSVSLDAISCISYEPMSKDEQSLEENAQNTEKSYKIKYSLSIKAKENKWYKITISRTLYCNFRFTY